MKFLKLAFSFLLIILAINSISAIVSLGAWDSGSYSKDANYGEEINFYSEFFSMLPPMEISIKLYDSEYNLVHVFEDKKTINEGSYFKEYSFDTQMLENVDSTYQIIFQGKDETNSDSHTIYLNLKSIEVNSPPVISSTPLTQIYENEFYSYQIDAKDSDGDSLTYELAQGPEWLSINSEGLVFGTAPEVEKDTDYMVSIKVSDGEDYVTQDYKLTVINKAVENGAPVFSSHPQLNVYEGGQYSYQAKANDPDGDALNFYAINIPNWLDFSEDGLLSGTAPFVNSDQKYGIIIGVTDGEKIDTQEFVITVKNIDEINNVPVAYGFGYGVEENSQTKLKIKGTDFDEDDLVFSVLKNPEHGTVEILNQEKNGQVTYAQVLYAPNENFVGVDYFTYRVYDGEDYSNTAKVIITVNEKGVTDTTPPEITIISPENKVYENNKITFKIKTNEESESWFTLNGEKYYLEEISQNEFFEKLTLKEGKYDVVFYAEDLAGNIGSASVSFKIEKDNDDGGDDNCYGNYCENSRIDWIYGKPIEKQERPPIYTEDEKSNQYLEEEDNFGLLFWILFIIIIIGIIILLILIGKKARE